MNLIKDIRFSTMDRLGTISLFSSFAIAMVITIWAIYLDSFFHNAAYVGFFAAFLTITESSLTSS